MEKNYNLMEMKMAKRMLPGKNRNSKGKKVSHRPVRYENSWFCDKDRKWYKNPNIEEKKSL